MTGTFFLPQQFRLTRKNRAWIIAIWGEMKSGSRQNMAEPAVPKTAEDDLLRMTAEVVSAYVSNNTLATGQLADVIQGVYNSLRGLEGGISEPVTEPLKPAVPIRKSVTP